MKSVLTIAGSDSSGGAGIEADLKTIGALGCFGEAAITALTAQNTTGVYGIFDVDPDFIAAQIDVVFEDIRPDAVKVGMISHGVVASAIAGALKRNRAMHVVVDPVMVATSGSSLAADDAMDGLWRELFPMAEVITPNRHEAEALAESSIAAQSEAEQAAEIIAARCLERGGAPAILIKGGHAFDDAERADDLVRLADGSMVWLEGKRIANPNTHGTGCTLSSAIACGLAQGLDPLKAIAQAKDYVTGAIAAGLDLGHGSGPLDHFYRCRSD